jgi:ketosteroid isomerase-like protein
VHALAELRFYLPQLGPHAFANRRAPYHESPQTERGVVTLEYQVHGKAVKTGAAYDNRFASIVTIKDRQIVRWRDYMDSLAAWQALTGK